MNLNHSSLRKNSLGLIFRFHSTFSSFFFFNFPPFFSPQSTSTYSPGTPVSTSTRQPSRVVPLHSRVLTSAAGVATGSGTSCRAHTERRRHSPSFDCHPPATSSSRTTYRCPPLASTAPAPLTLHASIRILPPDPAPPDP
jgi:hypothetical protein